MTSPVRRLWTRLTKGQLARSFMVLVGGTAVGQVLKVVVSPILTRLYTPADYGVLAVYGSILAFVVVASSFRYELAVPIAENDEVAVHLLVLCGLSVLGTGLIVSLGVALYGSWIVSVSNAPGLAPYLWLIPVGLLGSGIYQALNYWAIRAAAFPLITKTKLFQVGAQVFTQLLFGLTHAGPFGLVLGQVNGQAMGSSSFLREIWNRHRKTIKAVTLKGLLAVARRYRRFPLISLWSGLISTAGLYLPSLLLSSFYGPSVAGWFSLSQRVVGFPSVLVGQAVAQVYMHEAARLAREAPKALEPLFWRIAKILLTLGGPPIVLLGIVGPSLFGWVFGANWYEAGHYIRGLALMFAAQFIVTPLSQTLNFLERQDLQLFWDAALLLVTLIALLLPPRLGMEPALAITLFGMAVAAAYVGLFAITAREVHRWSRVRD